MLNKNMKNVKKITGLSLIYKASSNNFDMKNYY